MSNTIRRGAKDFSFSAVLNSGKERVLHLGVLELLSNEQRCHCENCIVYEFFISKYLYRICICRIVYFGYTVLYVMCLLFR